METDLRREPRERCIAAAGDELAFGALGAGVGAAEGKRKSAGGRQAEWSRGLDGQSGREG